MDIFFLNLVLEEYEGEMIYYFENHTTAEIFGYCGFFLCRYVQEITINVNCYQLNRDSIVPDLPEVKTPSVPS